MANWGQIIIESAFLRNGDAFEAQDDIFFPDNVKALFGNVPGTADYEIYSNGTTVFTNRRMPENGLFNGSYKQYFSSLHWGLFDNFPLALGSGGSSDFSMKFDGTDMIIDCVAGDIYEKFGGVPKVGNSSSQRWFVDNYRLGFGSSGLSDSYAKFDGTNLIIDVVSGMTKLQCGGLNIAKVQSNKFEIFQPLVLSSDGEVSRCLWLSAETLRVPGVKPATRVELGLSSALEFSDGTDDTAFGHIVCPKNMDRAEDPVLKIGWSSPTADPGDNSKQAVWQVKYKWLSPGEDVSSTTPDDTLTVTTSASTSTNGLVLSEVTIDHPSATDICLSFEIKRLGADGSDTLGDDANLSGLCLEYISDKLGGTP